MVLEDYVPPYDRPKRSLFSAIWLPFCVFMLLVMLGAVMLLTWDVPKPSHNIERKIPNYVFDGRNVPPPEE